MTKRHPTKQPAARPSPTLAAQHRAAALQRIVLRFTLGAFALQPLASAAAIVSAGGAYGPQVGTAQNGVTVVQITAPTAGGVSRNDVLQNDVTRQGVVYNNSKTAVITQLAGAIDRNPNLTGDPARIVYVSVVGNLPSDLSGFMEVGGTRAELVISNPNGITCNGCGFINTTRGVLTTGTAVFGANGSLDAFRVTGGTIAIDGDGLNASNIDRVDLIARSVRANAKLWARELNVVAGAAQTQYADLSSSAIAGTGPAPTVAIDVAALGGMYANKIRLIGTEAGVGVASAGELIAQADGLTITSAGQIALSGTTQSAGALTLDAQQNIALSGTTYAGGNATISSRAGITSTGTLAAAGDLTLTADTLDIQGLLAAGMTSEGQFSNTGTLTASATNNFKSRGQHKAGRAIVFRGGSLDLSNSQTYSNGTVGLTATNGDIAHRGGTLIAAGDVNLSATGSIDNGGGGKLQSGGTLALTTGGDYTHTADSTLIGDAGIALTAGGNLTLAADLKTPGTLRLTAGSLLDNQANLVGTDVELNAATADNQGVIAAINDLTASVSGRLTNRSGKLLYAGNNQRLYADELYNEEDGVLYAGANLAVQKNAAGDAASSVTNHLGTIWAENDLTIKATVLNNEGSAPEVKTRTTTTSLPYNIGACSPDDLSTWYCSTRGETNAAGETIYYSLYGSREITPGELQAFYAQHPDAPTSNPDLPRNYSGLTSITTFAQWITANFTHFGDYRDLWRIDLTQTQQYLDAGASSKAGNLVAGRDFSFNSGTANNIASQIYAARDVNLTGTAVTNSTQSLQSTSTYTTCRYTNGETTGPVTGFFPDTTSSTTSTQTSNATITAGGTLNGNAASGITNAHSTAPTTVAPTAPANAVPTGVSPVGDAPAIALNPSNAPDPTYPIERDPKYLDLNRFLAQPDHDRTPNIDWQGTHKQQDDLALSRERLLDTTFTLNGLHGIDNTRESDARYQAFMKAAYAAGERFDFENGIALTPESIAQLTRDIVWRPQEGRIRGERRGFIAGPAHEIALIRLTPADLTPSGILRAADPIELMTPDFTPVGRRDATGRSTTGSPGGDAASPRQNDEPPNDAAAGRLRHGILFGGNDPAPTAPR